MRTFKLFILGTFKFEEHLYDNSINQGAIQLSVGKGNC